MKKVLTYILGIIYLNMALVPHLREVDSFMPVTYQHIDEVNSLFEMVNIWIGYDNVADDEDGDTGTEDDSTPIPNVIVFANHYLDSNLSLNLNLFFDENLNPQFEMKDIFISSIYYGIESPPPEV